MFYLCTATLVNVKVYSSLALDHYYFFLILICFFTDYLLVGHQHSAQGGKDCGCQDHLHRPHCCGGGRLLAPAARVPLWICG